MNLITQREEVDSLSKKDLVKAAVPARRRRRSGCCRGQKPSAAKPRHLGEDGARHEGAPVFSVV